MDNRTLAKELVCEHGTRNPFVIADALGIIVIETPLNGIRGFYQTIHRCQIIYVDNQLSEPERVWVCAHELGHAMLHKGFNRLFMDSCTYMVTNKYELEADRFAVDLLVPDDIMEELAGFSVDTVAQCLGLPRHLAAYRMESAPQ